MFSTDQYGFRSRMSTSLAVYDTHENLLQSAKDGLTTCAVLCDLSKAFDIIDHDILLWKLDTFYGIRGLPLKLLASYLQGRQQYTVVGDYRSSMLDITQVVPQGSSRGSLLIALCVNDLAKASAFNSTLFSDDTVLSISSGNCIELQKLVNTELQKVDEWMRFNKLPINYSKTSYMLIVPEASDFMTLL